MSLLMRWVNRITPWFSVAVLALTMIVLAFPIYLQLDAVLGGGGDPWLLVVRLIGEAVIVIMGVLGVYSIVPQRVRLSPSAVTALGIAAFAGMFFLILLILRGEIYAAVPVIVYVVRIRRDLADELPVAAGGRRPPGSMKAKKRRDPDAVTSRPPRSWEPDGGVKRKPAGAKSGAKRAKRGKRRH